MSKKRTYQDLSKNSQIVLRPEMYIGSMSGHQAQQLNVLIDGKVATAKYNIAPGLMRIFIEIMCNAADNVVISRENGVDVGVIEVTIRDTEISVKNGGSPMRIEKMVNSDGQEEWIPTVMFSSMFSSSHYQEIDRYTAGLNGIGAKACNTFSESFKVEVDDGIKSFYQEWKNCSESSNPKIGKTCGVVSVKVSFVPDMKFFPESSRLDECPEIIRKMCSDLAFCLRSTIKFNDEVFDYQGSKIKDAMIMRGSEKYACLTLDGHKLYLLSCQETRGESFVNCTPTRSGGTHVNSVFESLATSLLVSKHNKDKKLDGITGELLQKKVSYILCSTVCSPTFDGNNKDRLNSKLPPINTDTVSHFLDTIDNSLPGFIKMLKDIMTQKNNKAMNQRLKRSTQSKYYIAAHNAGKKRTTPVSLWVAEGPSAQKYIKDLILAIKGNYDNDGILPLQGVPISARGNSHEEVMANKQIQQLQLALDLKVGADYSPGSQARKELRYDRIIIGADADVDGYHIRNLVIDMIEMFAPQLLKDKFVYDMQSPILRLINNNKQTIFYNKSLWHSYETKTKRIIGTIKYCKGLGSSSPSDTQRDAEEGLNKIIRPVETHNGYEEDLKLAFDPELASKRKVWIAQQSTLAYDPTVLTISYSIHNDLKEHSLASIRRGIKAWDGFNEPQRMIVWALLKKTNYNINTEVKFESVTGYILDHYGYEHGAESLGKTMKGMAVGYPGTNNLPILYPCGNCGSRDKNGDDAAASRYLKTRLRAFVPYLFHDCDEELLTHTPENGEDHGPDFLLPVIPLWAVNQSRSLATGWSSFIAPRNPDEVIDTLISIIKSKGRSDADLLPWYRYYDAKINTTIKKQPKLVENDEAPTVDPKCRKVYATSTYTVTHKDNKTTIRFTELPIYRSFQWYKEYFDQLKEILPTLEVKNDTGTVKIDITVTVPKILNKSNIDDVFPTNLAIQSTNMYILDDSRIPKKLETITDGLIEFYHKRLPFYDKRRALRIERLQSKLSKLDSKIKFIDHCFVSAKFDLSQIAKVEGQKALRIHLEKHHIPLEAIKDLNLLSIKPELIMNLDEERKQIQNDLDDCSNRSSSDEWIQDLITLKQKIHQYYLVEDVDCKEPKKRK